jgi:5-methylcytosine-specific restriction endonuclease McrA
MGADEASAKSNAETAPVEPPSEPLQLVTLVCTRPAVIKPLAPEIYKVQFTLSSTGYRQLRRAQDLLRHTIPNGDAGVILEQALGLLVHQLERKKLAAAKRPRVARESQAPTRSRHIPAAVRRDVWRRDQARCAFVGTHGRCPERGFLEFHHVSPFADGGEATAGNIQLRCRAHHQHEADLWDGADIVKNRPPGYASP